MYATSWSELNSLSITDVISDVPNWDSLALDVRLKAANHIVEMSWRDRKTWWTREDIAHVFFDVLHEMVDQPIEHIPLDDIKELLRQVYLGAWDVIPSEYRDF